MHDEEVECDGSKMSRDSRDDGEGKACRIKRNRGGEGWDDVGIEVKQVN